MDPVTLYLEWVVARGHGQAVDYIQPDARSTSSCDVQCTAVYIVTVLRIGLIKKKQGGGGRPVFGGLSFTRSLPWTDIRPETVLFVRDHFRWDQFSALSSPRVVECSLSCDWFND